MSDIETFRSHLTQARLIAPYASDTRLRFVLEVLARELEQKIADIERQGTINPQYTS